MKGTGKASAFVRKMTGRREGARAARRDLVMDVPMTDTGRGKDALAADVPMTGAGRGKDALAADAPMTGMGRGKDARAMSAPWSARLTKAIAALGAAAAVLSLSPALPAEAAYTYEVRIQTGAQGRFADDKSTVKEYEGGADGRVSVTFDLDSVELPEGSKYYVKGIRRSGTAGTMGGLDNPSIVVTEDTDYVVVYGIKDDHQVSYTVKYEDVDGNGLAEPKKGQGNIGDTPIIGHLPIDGYVPQAYNLTKTLKDNEAENVFTFVYTRMIPVGGGSGTETVTEETVDRTDTQTVTLPGAGGGTTGGGQTAILEDGGTTVIEGGGAGAAGEAGVEGGEGAAEGPQEPEELINLDDEETPLAGPGGGDDGAGGPVKDLFRMPPAVLAGLVSAVVLVLAGIYLLIAKKKRKEGPEGEE